MEISTVEEALEELRAGRIILCIDDPDRENEGDMICAASPRLIMTCVPRVFWK